MPTGKRRIPIHKDIQAQILFQNDHRCCICHKGPQDGVRVQIHHINENPSDNRPENLAVLCRDCHDKLKDKLWMGKNYIQDEIMKYKLLWERAVAKKRKHLEYPPAIIKEKIIETVDEKGRTERRIDREICYIDGLAPQALGISPPFPLSPKKTQILEDVKQTIKSQTPSEKLLTILEDLKKTKKIVIDDMVILSRLCLAIGDTKFHAYDYGMAEIFYKEALNYGKSAKEPKITELCLYELGASVGMQGRHEEALGYFNKIIKVNKSNQDVWFNRGVALYFLNKRREAVDSYLKAIEFGTRASDWSTVASAYSNMGNALAKLDKSQEAVDSYLKAIEFGTRASDWSTVASAYYNMGTALAKLDKYQEAVDSFLKAIELRKFLPDQGLRIFPTITALICILGIKNVQKKEHYKAKRLSQILLQVYIDSKKYRMDELIVNSIEKFSSLLSKNEDKDAFHKFKKLFDKSKN